MTSAERTTGQVPEHDSPFHAGVPVNEITAAMAYTARLPIQYRSRTLQRGLSVGIAIGHNHRAPWSSGIHTPENPCLRHWILCILCRPDVDDVVNIDKAPVNKILVIPRNPLHSNPPAIRIHPPKPMYRRVPLSMRSLATPLVLGIGVLGLCSDDLSGSHSSPSLCITLGIELSRCPLLRFRLSE